jgi:hypothetical protein
MQNASDIGCAVIPVAGVSRRGIATGIDLLAWVSIAWFTWLADIPIVLGTTSKWRAVAELAAIHLIVPVYFLLEVFSGATIGKWATGLAVYCDDSRSIWLFRLLRWLLKSSPWLLMTADSALVIGFEREVMPALFQRMTDQLARGGDWCLSLLDHVPISDWWAQWLMLPLAAGSQLQIGVLLLVPLSAGELLVLLPARRTLIDRLTKTRVVCRQTASAGTGFEVSIDKPRQSAP